MKSRRRTTPRRQFRADRIIEFARPVGGTYGTEAGAGPAVLVAGREDHGTALLVARLLRMGGTGRVIRAHTDSALRHLLERRPSGDLALIRGDGRRVRRLTKRLRRAGWSQVVTIPVVGDVDRLFPLVAAAACRAKS